MKKDASQAPTMSFRFRDGSAKSNAERRSDPVWTSIIENRRERMCLHVVQMNQDQKINAPLVALRPCIPIEKLLLFVVVTRWWTDNAPHVVTAFWAHGMCRNSRAAIRAHS